MTNEELLEALSEKFPRPLVEAFFDGFREAVTGEKPAPRPPKPRPDTVRLADFTVGYPMARHDDCLQAAIATCLQVPVDDVPDPKLTDRLARGETPGRITASARDQLDGWLAARGLRMIEHHGPACQNERWIGVVPPLRARQNEDTSFTAHCLVIVGAEIIFDPFGHVARAKRWTLDEIAFGYRFQPINKED